MSGALKPFGLFLHLLDVGRLQDFPVADREYIINRLNELIDQIDDPKLTGPHYASEKERYVRELKIAKQAWNL